MILEIQTFLLAMSPIGELRISLPIALTIFHLNWQTAFLISVAGNLTSVALLLLFLKPFSNWLSKIKIFKKFFSWLFKRTREKHKNTVKKYGYWALVLFVATPLPITGGWTGSLIAFLFGIPFKIAFPLIALGVLIAGIIVSLLVQTGIVIENYFNWKILLVFLMIISLICLIIKKIQKNVNAN